MRGLSPIRPYSIGRSPSRLRHEDTVSESRQQRSAAFSPDTELAADQGSSHEFTERTQVEKASIIRGCIKRNMTLLPQPRRTGEDLISQLSQGMMSQPGFSAATAPVLTPPNLCFAICATGYLQPPPADPSIATSRPSQPSPLKARA
ncbi:hypothetical protein SKAU_G00099570 [Synaphobranchus kaupii]|uniref:Uncharacterized protein n=1 Tax=Synaphobranchus kaupii TaxID=118154 RepID=A0A9Q1FYW0_SYNKA|nr:hypothetical protein SKAU_G00099570 [Synaphobranchus kaupii]